jgi:GNAT superfamily N-acetyltransferase
MNGAPFSVRPMEERDTPSVARLSGELGYPADAHDIGRRWGVLAGRPDMALLVAVDPAGAILGWIHVGEDATLTDERIAEIRGLVVAEGSRGRGVGRALVEASECWSASHGCSRVRVRTRIARAEAHRFYEACGYALEKTQHVFSKPIRESRPVS